MCRDATRRRWWCDTTPGLLETDGGDLHAAVADHVHEALELAATLGTYECESASVLLLLLCVVLA